MRARDASVAAAHRERSAFGLSEAAEFHSQSPSADQSTLRHGSARSTLSRKYENQWSSTHARCFMIPPSVMVEGATRVDIPAASSPRHFHSSVARW